MRRRKKKQRIQVLPLLWGLALLNLGLGMQFSTITSVRVVRVVGAPPEESARLERVLQSLRDVPALRVSTLAVEGRVLDSDQLRGARYSQNIFGRGLLTVTARLPVARVAGESDRAIGADGVIFATSTAALPSVEVVLPEAALRPNLSWQSGWDAARIARLAQDLAKRWPQEAWKVEVSPRGVISLRGTGEAEITLGSSENLEAKLSKLEEILAEEPDALKHYGEINLMVPSAPMTRPR